jgi:uncharacterized protein YjcR
MSVGSEADMPASKKGKSKAPKKSRPAPFVPKLKTGAPEGNKNALGNDGGRPSPYEPELHSGIARAMALAGNPDYLIAKALGVAISTFYLWKAEHVEFSEALLMGKEVANEALRQTAWQRAMGFA